MAGQGLHGQAFSPLGSSPLQDFQPPLGAFPCSKTVCPCFFDIAWLECPFHGIDNSILGVEVKVNFLSNSEFYTCQEYKSTGSFLREGFKRASSLWF
jgi:hypothetical protein